MAGTQAATTMSRNTGAPAFTQENQMFERKPPSRAVQQANKAFKSAQREPTDYEKTQKAVHDNHERLKAERLAREAAGDRPRTQRP